jgi:hypothetical protein
MFYLNYFYFQYGHSVFNGPNEVPSGCYSTHILLKSGSCIVQLAHPDQLANPDQHVNPEIPLNLAATINCALATMMNAISTFEILRKAFNRNKKEPTIAIIVRSFETK